MNVVIVTGTAPHHQHLCATLADTHHVVGIIHPAEVRSSPGKRFQLLLKQSRKRGRSLTALYLLGKLLRQRNSAPVTSDAMAAAEKYNRIPRALIHHGCDVRETSTHRLLASMRPDVTLCLGGPVYPTGFISASPLTLNFHSGISPLYNGTASTHFAYANGHPHLCGGTLMVIDTTVDGGRILGHYLPAVASGDSPSSLFAKTVQGAVTMYDRVLRGLEAGGLSPQSIRQPTPLFYTRGFDLGLFHQAMIAMNLRADVAARYERCENVVEYWREPTADAALELYRKTLDQLLWMAPKPKK